MSSPGSPSYGNLQAENRRLKAELEEALADNVDLRDRLAAMASSPRRRSPSPTRRSDVRKQREVRSMEQKLTKAMNTHEAELSEALERMTKVMADMTEELEGADEECGVLRERLLGVRHIVGSAYPGGVPEAMKPKKKPIDFDGEDSEEEDGP